MRRWRSASSSKREQAEAILQNGQADLIAVGRQSQFNPNIAHHWAHDLGINRKFEDWTPEYGWWLEKRIRTMEGFATPIGVVTRRSVSRRHARACPGHHVFKTRESKNVDGRRQVRPRRRMPEERPGPPCSPKPQPTTSSTAISAGTFPTRFNMATACCDRHADGTGRLALIYVDEDGATTRTSFDEVARACRAASPMC